MLQTIISLATRFIPRHMLQRMAGMFLRLVGTFYLGQRYEDPISGRRYRRMLPYGRIHVRQNALAPHSMSLERHRLIWLYLQQRTDFFSAPMRVLHIAPEYCFIKRFKRMSNLSYTTADLNSPWADVKMDIQQMPLADDTFDVVLCNHVLEHVPDDRQAMRELFRVLRPGGFAILQVPLDPTLERTLEDPAIDTPELREQRYGQRDHLRLYGLDYGQRLAEAGFCVSEDDFVRTLAPELVTRYALPPAETLYVCHKPQPQQPQ
ncbi:MAG: methyltransferase domain-containing protein [Bacteroidales bacterium]|nr:methyltransferase domain-containing protein [Bacteroidales bacterium]